MQPFARAFFVFFVMSVLTLQTWSRVLEKLPGGEDARGVRGINAVLDFVLISWAGVEAATGVMAVLTVIFTVMAFLRTDVAARGDNTGIRRQPPTPSVSKSRIASAVRQAPAPVVAPTQHKGESVDSRSIVSELIARSGRHERAAQLPAWALLFRSPFAPFADVTSWLGGVPHAPAGFEWPNDVDGTPLHFLAQIDLAAVQPEPESGHRPPGLPVEGSLLVFIGESYACRVLGVEEMLQALPVPLPEGLEPVSKHGFFSEEQCFTWRPVDPVAYLSMEGRPAFMPERFVLPRDWIKTWAIAVLDAEAVTDCLESSLRVAQTSERLRQTSAIAPPHDIKGAQKKVAYEAIILREAPLLLRALKDFLRLARSRPKEDAVDVLILDEIFSQRMAMSDQITDTYEPKLLLPGSAQAVWYKLQTAYPDLLKQSRWDALPACYRSFAEAWITDWRDHRLFGVEPEFPNNWEDFRGHDCLISIAADDLLRTQSEHEYGMSVWCPQLRIANGLYDQGMFVRHSKG